MNAIEYIIEMSVLARQGETQGLYFVIAALALFFFLCTFVIQKMICRWPFAEGELTGVLMEKNRGFEYFVEKPIYETDYDADQDTLYQYSVAGEDFNGKRVSPWIFLPSQNIKFLLNLRVEALDWLPGKKIKVFYNPRNPKKSYLIKPGIKSQFITGSIAVLPMAFYVLNYL